MEYVAALPVPRKYTPGIPGSPTLPAVGFTMDSQLAPARSDLAFPVHLTSCILHAAELTLTRNKDVS
jgi:hypothetical protein